MAQIPLGVGAYDRQYGKLPPIRMENRFHEHNPLGAEQTALLSRPGTKLFVEVGAGPIRAMHTQPGAFGGDLFIVSGDTLYRCADDTPAAIDGTVDGDGYTPMAAVAIPGFEALFITDGSSLQYYDGIDNELKPSAVPDSQTILDLAVLASHVMLAVAGTHKFYWILPGETEVTDALNFASAESEPDHIINLLTLGDNLWLFGESTTEVWYATGDETAPFRRVQGQAFSQGIIPGTLAKAGEAVVVMGRDRVAYRIAGAPERISHHGMEELFRIWQDSL